MIATKPSPTAATGPAGHSLLSGAFVQALSGRDGRAQCDAGFILGRRAVCRPPARAWRRPGGMIAEGADIIDIGAESTRPYGSETDFTRTRN